MVSETITISKKLVGERVKRKEDARLLNGRGRFIDDLKLPNMHYVSILRSTYAHAKIVRIDISRAMIPGVVMIVTGKEITELSNPMMPAPAIPIKHYCMAIDKVRFVGEPVAAVVALDRYTAEDALEYITVDYEPLETVTETDEALKSGSPVLHESVGSNLAWQKNLTYGEVDKDFESADEVIKERFSVHRVSPTPIETFGVVASYEAFSNSLVIYSNTEIPGMLLNIISGSLKVPQLQLHLVNFDNGGSFGAKGGLHYLLLMSVVSIKTGLPVKFVEDRKENLLALQQGEETEYRVEAAIKKDGTILSLKVNIDENVGAYPAFPEPEGILEQLLCGAYKIRSYSLKANLVMSNKCPTGPCRGYGRYNSAFVIERTIEAVAKKYHIDPTEVRFQNFIPETEFPYKAPNGNLYDSGNYKENLMKALKLFDYEGARAQQKTAKSAGRNLGIGIGFIVEIGTPNFAHFGLVSNQPPASL